MANREKHTCGHQPEMRSFPASCPVKAICLLNCRCAVSIAVCRSVTAETRIGFIKSHCRLMARNARETLREWGAMAGYHDHTTRPASAKRPRNRHSRGQERLTFARSDGRAKRRRQRLLNSLPRSSGCRLGHLRSGYSQAPALTLCVRPIRPPNRPLRSPRVPQSAAGSEVQSARLSRSLLPSEPGSSVGVG